MTGIVTWTWGKPGDLMIEVVTKVVPIVRTTRRDGSVAKVKW